MTKMRKINTICAGIDTSKAKLDVAIEREIERLQVNNDADGHRALSAWLRQRSSCQLGISILP